jgi:hypothetical protein
VHYAHVHTSPYDPRHDNMGFFISLEKIFTKNSEYGISLNTSIRVLTLSIRNSQSDRLNSVPVLRNMRLVIFVIFHTKLIYKLNLWS